MVEGRLRKKRRASQSAETSKKQRHEEQATMPEQAGVHHEDLEVPELEVVKQEPFPDRPKVKKASRRASSTGVQKSSFKQEKRRLDSMLDTVLETKGKVPEQTKRNKAAVSNKVQPESPVVKLMSGGTGSIPGNVYREIFVRPLPRDVLQADVFAFFSERDNDGKWAGAAVERVKIVCKESTKGGSVAFVTLKTPEDAKRCVVERSGIKLSGQALSISIARDRDGGKEPCMFYLEGKCKHGDQCKFSHESESGGATLAALGRRLPVCTFFSQGCCSRGAACKFSHNIKEDAEMVKEAVGHQGEVEQERAAATRCELRFDPTISLPSLFEDEDVLAVNKPPGILSHPSPGYWEAGTVVHALVGRVSDAMLCQRADHAEENSYIPRAIVHRLDQGTTGVMVVAKTLLAERQLSSVLRGRRSFEQDRLVKKAYVAILLGCPGGSGCSRTIEVNDALGRDSADPRRMVVKEGGQAASSVVHVHCHNEQRGTTLVTVEIHTGRMHQIRVHCAHIGAPVAGDPVYGDREAEVAFREAMGSALPARRPLLHAWELVLPHPRPGKEHLSLQAPLPDDMWEAITQLWPNPPPDLPFLRSTNSPGAKPRRKKTPKKKHVHGRETSRHTIKDKLKFHGHAGTGMFLMLDDF